MAKLSIVAGTTSKLLDIFVLDSSKTDGSGLTGLTNASSGLTWYYYREGAASATQVTSIASMTLGTWTTKGFIVIDGTNMPGMYQIGVPDAAIAAGAASVVMMLRGVTNMAPVNIEIELTTTNNQDAVRGGMTALPNANAEAAGGLYTRGTGAGQINQDANGRVDTNTKAWAGTAVTLTSSLPDVNTKTIANGIVAAATFAANALDAVWATTTRLLTAGTNIVLAKGTGVTGFNDLDAAGVRGAVGLASANLDTQLTALQADTDNIQTRLPAALVGGRMDASVGAIAAGGQTDIRSAVGIASANLDTQLTTIDNDVNALPTGDENADALLDRANAIETSLTLRGSMRLISSVLAGKLSGGSTTTNTFRNAVADSKDRVTATVDSSGNRTAITTDTT